MATGARDVSAGIVAEHLHDEDQRPEDVGGSGNIDKIRDILFGALMRDYEARFRRLEDRMTKEGGKIKEEIRNRSAALEGLVREEIRVLADRFKVEREERKEAIAAAAGQLHESIRSVERKHLQLEDSAAESQRELRRQMFEHSNSISEQIRHQHEELARLVEQRFGDLRSSMPSRISRARGRAELGPAGGESEPLEAQRDRE